MHAGVFTLLLAALGFSLGACLDSAAEFEPAEGEVVGTVADASGVPLPGVLVTATDAAGTVAVSVRTDARGRYRLPWHRPIAAHLQARQRGRVPLDTVTVVGRQGAVADLRLLPQADAFDPVPSSAWLALLPDGEAKQKFILDCTGCHQFDEKIVGAEAGLKSEAQWTVHIERMIGFAGGSSQFPIMAPGRRAAETAAWLTAHLGEGPRPTFDPPVPPAAPSVPVEITEYTLPVATDLPHDLMLDAEGQVVITGMNTHQMYRLDPASGRFTTVPIPEPYANPRALDIDPETGDWWVLLGWPRKIAHYARASQTWTLHDIGMYPHSMVHEAGRVWFNGHFTKDPELIGYLDTETGAVQTYEVPTPPMPDGGSTIPYGLRRAPDGTLWATQLVGNRLIRFVPETEHFTLYELPTPHSGPRRPDVAPDGSVWIPQYAANKIAHFDPSTETFREYELPVPDALPYIVRVAPSGRIWIATAAADAVLAFDPSTEAFSVYPLPTRSALVRHMDLNPQTGDVWVAYGNAPAVSPKIARLRLRE